MYNKFTTLKSIILPVKIPFIWVRRPLKMADFGFGKKGY